MEKTVCINAAAGCTAEGGKFHYLPSKDAYVCDGCYRGVRAIDTSRAMWPMTLHHLQSPNHGPVVAQSLRHLRQIEAQHGVGSVAFNQDSANWQRG